MAKQVKALNINDSVALESDMGSKLNQSAAAPEFRSDEYYPAGYHVTRNGNLYKFTSDHPAGAWTGEDVILEDMTTPDAMLDITAAGFLRVVAADGTIMWVQNTLSASRTEIASVFSQSAAYSPLDLVVYNNVLYKCTAAHAAGAWDASHFALATVDDILKAIRSQEAADVSRLEGEISPLQFAAWYPDGSVMSVSQFTSGLNYTFDTANHTATVNRFLVFEEDSASDNNGQAVGAVVIPPYVDHDGTRYTVIGVGGYGDWGDELQNENLTSITAPATVTNIGLGAFESCTALVSANLPGVTTLEGEAFFDCSSLSEVEIPKCTTVGSQAFLDCYSLKSISMPLVTSFGDVVFSGAGLESFLVTPLLTEIPEFTFEVCNLKHIELHNLTGNIGQGAFIINEHLEYVDFGPNVRSSIPEFETGWFEESPFSGVPTTCKFIVPDDNYTAWTTASGWSDLVAAGYRFIRYSEWEYARKYELAEKAPLASPAFTGTPTAPDPGSSPETRSQVVTKKYVDDAFAVRPTKSALDEGWWSDWVCEPATFTPAEDPSVTFTFSIRWDDSSDGGDPTAIGWALYANGEIVDAWYGDENSSSLTVAPASGSPTEYDDCPTTVTATRHRVAAPVPTQPSDIGAAPLASPAFTGTPTAPTPSSGDNSTKIATTAFVSTAISGKAPIISPSFIGTPTAPTPASSDNSTKIATTAFVKSAISQISFQPLAGQTMPESPTQRELTAAVKLIFTALGGTIGGGGGGGSYTLNSDGTVSTEGTLNNDGTLTVEGTLNEDGTLTVEAS